MRHTHYNLPRNGLKTTDFSTILSDQLRLNQFKQVDTALGKHAIEVYTESAKVKVFVLPTAATDIYYGNNAEIPPNFSHLFQHIQNDPDTTRFCIPISEKRIGSKIGHYSLMVIDKMEDGQYEATIYDSKTNTSILARIIRFFASIFSIPVNADRNIQAMIETNLPNCTFKREYYGHQPSAFDNTCGAFTLCLLNSDHLLSNAPDWAAHIPAPNSMFTRSTSFLSVQDIDGYATQVDTIQSNPVGSAEFHTNLDMQDLELSDDDDENITNAHNYQDGHTPK